MNRIGVDLDIRANPHRRRIANRVVGSVLIAADQDRPAARCTRRIDSRIAEQTDSIAQQISIESAQPKIDLGVLKDLAPKKVMLGVIDLNDPAIETPQKIAERIRAGLKYMSPDKLLPAPDCGMKYLPRATAFGKLKALAEGAAIVRKELG